MFLLMTDAHRSALLQQNPMDLRYYQKGASV